MNFVSSVELIEPVEPVEPNLEGQCWTSEEGWSVRIGLKTKNETKGAGWGERTGLQQKGKNLRQRNRDETKWHGWDEEPGWNEQRKIMILWSEKDSVKTHSFTPGPCPTKHYAECVNKFDMFSQLKKITPLPHKTICCTREQSWQCWVWVINKKSPLSLQSNTLNIWRVGMLSNSEKWFLTYKMINSKHAVDILSHFLNKFTSPWTLQTSTLKVWRTLTYWVI